LRVTVAFTHGLRIMSRDSLTMSRQSLDEHQRVVPVQ
jgi:hypothetical protein